MSDNIFKILNIANKEDVVSNLLAHSLNNIPLFRNSFGELILDVCNSNYKEFEAYTRTNIPKIGVPDIVITFKQNEKQYLVILENKLKAKEGADQTQKYASEKMLNELKDKLNIINPKVKYVFLTLFPDQEPINVQFEKITYQDLLDNRFKGKTTIENLLNDFIEILDNFYDCSKITPNDDIFEKLSSVSELDGGYLYFQSFLKELSLNNTLNIEKFFRDSKSGRKYYGARISKPKWHPSKLDLNNPETFIPNKHFNIHFEPQYNVLKGKFTLYLHYETNPYKPKKWVDKNIPKQKYDKYWELRKSVKNKLKNKNIKEIKISGRTNQIAKATINFKNKNAKEIISKLEKLINKVSVSIDDILNELDI